MSASLSAKRKTKVKERKRAVKRPKPKLLKTALFGSSAFALICALNQPVLAQETDQGPDEELEIEEIVVTGSRIRGVDINAVRPSISVGAETLDKRAFTNIADALNEVPVFGGGVTPNGGQNGFSVGQNFVDLFDLGTQRTLTLVNGRRFVSSNTPTIFGSAGGLQVDLNAIPVALLERTEVVPLAGAAVYGSDAIAGTVNVILRDDYEGFEISGQYGITGEGDGETYQVQSVFGGNFADGRGNAVISVEYNSQEGLVRLARPNIYDGNPDFLAFGLVDLDGDGQSDDFDGDGEADSVQRFVEGDNRVQVLSFGGAIDPGGGFLPSLGAGALPDGNFYQFQPDGTLATCEPGVTPSGSPIFAYGGTCGADFFDEVTQIRSDLTRFVVSGFGHFDLTDNIRAFTEYTFANSEARELLNQGGFQSFPFGGTSGPVTLSVDNPLLTDQARGVLIDNGLTTFNVNRFNNDLVSGGQDSTENFTWRSASGFEGDFKFMDRDFYWDVSAVFGQADVETQGFGIVDGRFLNAIDVVEVTQDLLDANGLSLDDIQGIGGTGPVALGDTICRVVIDSAAGNLDGFNEPASGSGITDGDRPFSDGCVPLNLFGEGNQDPAAIDFINGGPQITSSDIGQRVFTANLTGDVIELPGGMFTLAAGFEARREIADFTPGLGSAVPITRSSPILGQGGQLNTREFYGEGLVPIFGGDFTLPGFQLLEINGSARRVRNRITDPNGNESVTNVTAWEIGGRWQPVQDITLRGSLTRSIRLPSLVELFTPTVQAFISAPDPCDQDELTAGPRPETRQANCLQAAAAAGFNNATIGTDSNGLFGLILSPGDNVFVSNVSNATIIGASSGNPNLRPERGRSFTVGGVFTPRWVEALSISIDYFSINIEERIENFDLGALFETCYDDLGGFGNDACGSFDRDATFQVSDATEQFLNASSSEFSALVGRMQYQFGVSDAFGVVPGLKNTFANTDYGTVQFDWNVTHRLNDVTTIVPTRPGDQDVGDFLDPTWQATFDTTWQWNAFRFFYRVLYQDSPLLDETGQEIFLDQNDNPVLDTRARLLHNMSFAYTFFDNVTVQLGIDNLLNREPNDLEKAAFYFGVSEELGRRFTFRLRTTF
ncbi:hypothetical protein CCR80_06505 [Rhodothalassium salexigens]|uniref:TonB-dependent receptor domain-containing protein n=1 Tax=Rhodothalassium salexigens TaxID=1086 RepID=UPI00191415A7|nr:TonB-dependent receptor [Rhodothalassium salexigens]MBK5920689.1 hypothetical protein [Rhodothalassium salexigens]